MDRRHFMEISSTAVLGISMSSSMWHNYIPTPQEIGLQLYTVRDEMGKNPLDTLKKVKQIGFSYVENTGYVNGKFYNKAKDEFKKYLDDSGLKMLSGHVNTGFNKGKDEMGLRYMFDKVCEECAYMGLKYAGVGWMPPEERKTIDDYKKLAELLNTSAVIAKKYGLTFFHHNHDFEFLPIDGVLPYDILLNETDQDLVKFELDHYWAKKANYDSIALIKKHKDRFPLWHIKDMDATPERFFTEVGTGIIDYQAIFNERNSTGNKLIFIEQDTCKNMPPLKSIELSFQNLSKLKI